MSKLGKEGHKCHFWNCFKKKKTKMNSDRLLHIEMRTKNGKGEKKSGNGCAGAFFLERERELISKFPTNSTVGSLRDKKGSCSTRRGLRVGTGFKEFRQTP